MGAYANLYGSSSTGSSNTPYIPAPSQGPEDKSLLGFLGNLGGGIVGTVGSLIGLGVKGLQDVADLGLEALTLGNYNNTDGYFTPQFLSNFGPAMVDDIKRRYFSGWDSFTNTFYNEPASYLLDIAGVATGAATWAGRVGQVGKLAEISGLARSVAAGDLAQAGALAEATAKLRPLARSVQLIRDSKLAQEALAAGVDVPATLGLAPEVVDAAQVTKLKALVEAGTATPGQVKLLDQLVTAGKTDLNTLLANNPASGTAKLIDRLAVRERLVGSGLGEDAGSIYVRNTARNPITRAIFQGPFERKYGLQTIADLEKKAATLSAEAEMTGNALLKNEAELLTKTVERMRGQGVYLSNTPLTQNWYFKNSVDKLLGTHRTTFYRQRNDLFAKLLQAVKGIPQEEINVNDLEGLSDYLYTGIDNETLLGILNDAGYKSVREAAIGIVSGNEQGLHRDVVATVLNSVHKGDISLHDVISYQPAADLAALPSRVVFADRVGKAFDAAGFSKQAQDFIMLQIDSNAWAKAGGTADGMAKYYDNLHIDFTETWQSIQGEKLKAIEHKLNLDRLAKLARDAYDNPKYGKAARFWYAESRRAIYEALGGSYSVVNGRLVRDSNLFMQILAVTSPQAHPLAQMGIDPASLAIGQQRAWEIFRRFKNGEYDMLEGVFKSSDVGYHGTGYVFDKVDAGKWDIGSNFGEGHYMLMNADGSVASDINAQSLAAQIAGSPRFDGVDGKTPNVMRSQVHIRNPYNIDAKFTESGARQLMQRFLRISFLEESLSPEEIAQYVERAAASPDAASMFDLFSEIGYELGGMDGTPESWGKDALMQLGYDGVVGEYRYKGHDIPSANDSPVRMVMAFHPDQIQPIESRLGSGLSPLGPNGEPMSPSWDQSGPRWPDGPNKGELIYGTEVNKKGETVLSLNEKNQPKAILRGTTAGTQIEHLREIFSGHFIEDWDQEAYLTERAMKVKQLDAARAAKKPNTSRIAGLEEEIATLDREWAASDSALRMGAAESGIGIADRAYGGTKQRMMGSKKTKSRRAVDATENALRANERMKVRNYYRNLVGDDHAVTIDRRMAVIFKFFELDKLTKRADNATPATQGQINRILTDINAHIEDLSGLTEAQADALRSGVIDKFNYVEKSQYQQAAQLVRDITDRINKSLAADNLPGDWKPAETQAVLWSLMQDILKEDLTTWRREIKSAARTVTINGIKMSKKDAMRYLKLMELSISEDSVNFMGYAEAMDMLNNDAAFKAAYGHLLKRGAEKLNDVEGLTKRLHDQVIGQYVYGPNGEHFIKLVRGATPTTVTHEVTHALLQNMRMSNPALAEQLRAIYESRGGLLSGQKIERVLAQARNNGSFAMRGLLGKEPQAGYMVPRGRTGSYGLLSVRAEDLSKFLHEHRAILENRSTKSYILLYQEPNQMRTWSIEIADHFTTLEEAKAAARAGNEAVVYDVLAGKRNPQNAVIQIGEGNVKSIEDIRYGADSPNSRGPIRPAKRRRSRKSGAADAPGDAAPIAPEWSRAAEEKFADDAELYLNGQHTDLDPVVAAALKREFTLLSDYLDPIYDNSSANRPWSRSHPDRRMRDIPRLDESFGWPTRGLTYSDNWDKRLTGDWAHTAESEQAALTAAKVGKTDLQIKLNRVFGLGTQLDVMSESDLAAQGLSALEARDLVTATVPIGSWADAISTWERFDAIGGKVGQIIDNTGTPSPTGERGYFAMVEFPEMPGVKVKVELATPKAIQVKRGTKAINARLEEVYRQIDEMKKLVESGDVQYRDLLALDQKATKGERLLQGIWEMVGDEIDVQAHGAPPLGGVKRQLIENLQLFVNTELVPPLLQQGIDIDQLFDRTYLHLRMKSGAAWDPRVRDIVGGKTALEIDAERAAKGLHQPVYFPDIDARRIRRSDFLAAGKKTVGMRSMAQAGFLERDMGMLWGDGNRLEDVVQAYQIRASSALRYLDAYNLSQSIIAQYGRKVESWEELTPGEVVFAPDGFLNFFNMKIGISDRMQVLLAKMRERGPFKNMDWIEESEFGSVLGEGLKSWVLDSPDQVQALVQTLNEIIPETQRNVLSVTKKGVDLYAIPKIVADRLNQSVGRTTNWQRLFFQKPTQVWRNFVLAGSPRWIINNVIGNTVFLKMQGGRLSDVVRQIFDKDFRAYLAKIGGDEVAGGFMQSQASLDRNLGVASETMVGKAYTKVAQSKPVTVTASIGDHVKRLNGVIEEYFRNASYVKALERREITANVRRSANRFWTSKSKLERMAAEGVTQGLAKSALDEVNYFMNDYQTLSPIEQNIIRQYVAPFYSFYKHSARLALSFPFKYPLRGAVMRSIAAVDRYMNAEEGDRPDWLKGAVPFGPGGKWLSTRGMDPFSQLTESPLSLLHPVWKVALEHFQGRDLFTGRRFTDPNVVEMYGGELFRVPLDSSGRPMAPQKIDRNAPGILEHLLRQFPQYSLLKQAVAGGRTYDSSTLLDALQGNALVRNATGQAALPVGPSDAALKFIGFSTFNYDLNNYQQRLAETQPDVLQAWYTRMGLG